MGSQIEEDEQLRIYRITQKLEIGLEQNEDDDYLVKQVRIAQQTILDLNPKLAAHAADMINHAIHDNPGISKQQKYQLRANLLLNVFRNIQSEMQPEIAR